MLNSMWLTSCREKKQAAKRMGKHHISSSEDDSDGAGSGDEGARTEKDDPFFAPEEDPFSDPFFQVSTHLLLCCVCAFMMQK